MELPIGRSSLLGRRVVAAFLLQSVGYAALLAVVPHSEPSALVGALQTVPTLLLLPFAIVAVPAVAVALAVGAVLSLVGLAPTSVPPLLLARGDVVFFGSAYAVGVVVVRLWAGDGDADTLSDGS